MENEFDRAFNKDIGLLCIIGGSYMTMQSWFDNPNREFVKLGLFTAGAGLLYTETENAKKVAGLFDEVITDLEGLFDITS